MVSVVVKEAVKRKLDYDSSERWGDGPRRPHLRGRKDVRTPKTSVDGKVRDC